MFEKRIKEEMEKLDLLIDEIRDKLYLLRAQRLELELDLYAWELFSGQSFHLQWKDAV